jgi:hypothetical protein
MCRPTNVVLCDFNARCFVEECADVAETRSPMQGVWGIICGNVRAQHRFNSISLQWSLGILIRTFFVHNDLVRLNSFTTVRIVSIWNSYFLKYTPESSALFPYPAIFRAVTVHDRLLFRCASHTWQFNTGTDATDWMFNTATGARDSTRLTHNAWARFTVAAQRWIGRYWRQTVVCRDRCVDASVACLFRPSARNCSRVALR